METGWEGSFEGVEEMKSGGDLSETLEQSCEEKKPLQAPVRKRSDAQTGSPTVRSVLKGHSGVRKTSPDGQPHTP